MDADATGLNDGSSWANAFIDLQDALSVATHGEGILVAEGIYKPITPADLGNVTTTEREASFQLISGVEIYGGFDPGDGDDTFGERDWEANPTILSGDIDNNDTITNGIVTDTDNISGDNSYHVVTSSANDNTTILDGFIITAGLANTGTLPNNVGGGMYIIANSTAIFENLTFIGNRAETGGGGIDNLGSDPTLTNVTFSNNSSGNLGGGMRNRSDASPTLNRVIFNGNSSDTNGGGMVNDNSSPELTDVIFINNIAGIGAGMANYSSSTPVLRNVIFTGNTSSSWGGGMHNDGSSPTLVNVVFTGNTSNRSGDQGGGGMRNRNSSNPALTNVIMWNNEANATSSESLFNDGGSVPVISNSIIEHSGGSNNWDSDVGTDGDNNLDTNPLFVDASDPDGPDNEFFTDDDGLALQSASIAINTGLNTPFQSGGDAEGVTTDLAGNSRIYDGLSNPDVVDMGAYEFQGERSGTASVVINGNAGWRMMGTPITGVTPGDLADLNLVQGISGLDYSEFDPNLYVWDPVADTPDFGYSAGAYDVPASGSTVLQPGTGFLWYMWGPEANPDVSESKSFPVTIELTGDEPAGDISLGTLEADWHLIANPFLDDINFDEITDGSGSQLGVTGQVWDSNEGEEGSYVLTTSGILGNQLSVWQGAFIELSSETEVIIPQSAKTTGATFLKEQEPPLAGQVEFLLEGLSDNGNVRSRDRAAILYFHQNASAEWDGYDVSKLIPLSESWATMNFVGNKKGEPVLKSQHSLPYDFTDSDVIPIEIQVQNMSGDFRLSWPVIQNLPLVKLFLEDRATGKRYDLSQHGSISFSRQAMEKEMSVPGAHSLLKLPELKQMKAKTPDPRFAILINPQNSGVDEIPTEITLNQNFPNPFNPSTVISYQLPTSSEVRVDVFDMVGRRIATLVNEEVQAGRHTVNFDGSALSSGVYMYRLQANGSVFTRKLTLIK